VAGQPNTTPQIRRPNKPQSLEVVARNSKIAMKWDEFSNMHAAAYQEVYDKLSSKPDYDDGNRQHSLMGEVGRGVFDGANYVRWQIDVTSGGRIWYFIDPAPAGKGQKLRSGRVIIDEIYPGHPKSTEKKPGRGRGPGHR
jgi:hypothetical protein